MTPDRLDQLIDTAISKGILPQGAQRPTDEQRPWPVILLTVLGAWLSTIPLLLFVVLTLGDALIKGVTPYVMGGLVLACVTVFLRQDWLPLFLEQFAAPGILVGGAMIGIKLYHDLGNVPAAILMAMLALAIAALIRRSWLRVLLGAAACSWTLLASASNSPGNGFVVGWPALHIALGVWILAQWLISEPRVNARLTAILEWAGLGWILVTLAALAFSVGVTFLVRDTFDVRWLNLHNPLVFAHDVTPLWSVTLAMCAGAWLVHCWPSLRQWWYGLTTLILVALAWLMPPLGETLLVLAVFCTARRWRLAMATGAAAAWIIGAFYYQLDYPLATKAMMMVGAGALLAAIAWMALRGQTFRFGGGAGASSSTPAHIGIAVCALAVLVVVNVGIWQKEALIANGRIVFVKLVPVDPRSLMQGDYMRLAFDLPKATRATGPVYAVGKVDSRSILTLDRIADGTPLAADELAIELTPKGAGWVLVTDAWYFKEGEAKRWADAKYGEFRVDANGRAQLTNLRGPALETLCAISIRPCPK